MSKGMTLNRAIRRAREKAEKLGCTDDGKEQLQLVGWLEELKRWRRLFCDKNVYYLPVIDRRGQTVLRQECVLPACNRQARGRMPQRHADH